MSFKETSIKNVKNKNVKSGLQPETPGTSNQ